MSNYASLNKMLFGLMSYGKMSYKFYLLFQLSWLEVMRRESTKATNKLSFRGIVLVFQIHQSFFIAKIFQKARPFL